MKKILELLIIMIICFSAATLLSCADTPEHVCDYKNGVCVECGEMQTSNGLSFELIDNGNAYRVKGIGECIDLSIVIPSKHNGKPVTQVGSRAFYNCDEITSIYIPESIKTVKSSSFAYCNSLTEIIVDKNNAEYKSIDGNLYDVKENCLIAYAPAKTESSFTVPDGVKKIGASAFSDCDNLVEIKIPQTVTEIGDDAFSDCDSLVHINLPEQIKKIGYKTFADCDMIFTITIPYGVESIGRYAFYSCDYLSNVTLPTTVNNIGVYAFDDCDSLLFTQKDGLNYLGDEQNPYHAVISPIQKSIKSVKIDDACKLIADNAFYLCSMLTSVDMGKGVERIGKSAFSDCSSIEFIAVGENVKVIDDRAFYTCNALKKIEIPNGVKEVYGYTFYNCEALVEIVFPDSVEYIGESAFYSCNVLKSITIGSGIKKIEKIAFYFCEELEKIAFNGTAEEWEKVEKGGYWCFGSATNKVVCNDKVVDA